MVQGMRQVMKVKMVLNINIIFQVRKRDKRGGGNQGGKGGTEGDGREERKWERE